MKSPNPSTQKAPSFLAAATLAASLLTCAPERASANLIYDMRAVGVDSPLATIVDPKHVAGLTPGTTVTFEIWVQILTASGTGVFGYQTSFFSILSSNGGSLLGNVGFFNAIAPWNSVSLSGTITASLDGDSDFDNGSAKPAG